MGMVVTLVRRSLWLVLIGALGGGVYAWWRNRSAPNPPGPAVWPPLSSTSTSSAAEPSGRPSSIARPSPNGPAPDGAATAPVANALVDVSGAATAGDSGAWVLPLEDGSCPVSHPIKANDNSGIFHVPEGRFYARTKAERCYTTAAAAIADGYRQAKN